MLTVLNDLHIGAVRNAGTTPATQLELRKANLRAFKNLLPHSDLMILGDLFDTVNIPIVDVLDTFLILKTWLLRGYRLVLVAGNHDLSRSSDILSSYDFLCKLLLDVAPEKVLAIKGAGCMTPWGYIIPHVANQDLFNHELSKVPDCEHLFLHCNYDNFFATQSDQSLNISKEQVDACPADKIIIAHEHHHRQIGKVYIPGSQLATSVSDWLGDEDKYFVTLSKIGLVFNKYRAKADFFKDMDWKSEELEDKAFIRISGEATAEEATKVVNMVNKVRKLSEAYVVSNAVKIQGTENGEAISQSLEDVRTFKVKEALFKLLSQREINTIESLA